MNWTNNMSQGALLKAFKSHNTTKAIETNGVCFRASTKWALCRAAGGVYRYAGLNIEKTYDKHRAYRDVTLKLAKTTNFAVASATTAYLDADFAEEQKFISQWGASFVDADKKRFTGYRLLDHWRHNVAQARLAPPSKVDPGQVFVYSFFWRKVEGQAPAGHTVAFDATVLFDPNFGETPIENDGIAARLAELLKVKYKVAFLCDQFLFLVGKPT